MFGCAAFSRLIGINRQTVDGNAALTRELNSAAMEGDDERVRLLLTQLLQCRTRRATDNLQAQVAALEGLFYSMRTIAFTDELTGVYNRRGFDWVASRILRDLCRERRGGLLLYIDIDNLKVINDTIGHAAGDRLLIAAGKVLRTACVENTIVGRVGGDEFALLAKGCGAESHHALRKGLQNAIAECNAAGYAPPLSMSIGVADFDPLRPASVVSLLHKADGAMYREKFNKTPHVAFESAPAPLQLAASAG